MRRALSTYGVASHALLLILIPLMLPETLSHYLGKKSLDVREVEAFVKNGYRPGDHVVSFVWEFDYYAADWLDAQPHIGHPLDNGEDWRRALKPYEDPRARVWFVLPAYRQPLATELEAWLMRNARLVWRRYQRRWDYTVMGYLVFLANDASEEAPPTDP